MVQDDDIPLAGSDLFELLFGQEFPVVDEQRGAERQPTQAIKMAASAAGPAGTEAGSVLWISGLAKTDGKNRQQQTVSRLYLVLDPARRRGIRAC